MSFDGNEGAVVDLKDASDWTAKYRTTISTGDTIAHFFGKNKLLDILNQTGCKGIRIYYGLNDDGEKVLILVGADKDEDDMTSGVVLDHSFRCPPTCSTSNVLNS